MPCVHHGPPSQADISQVADIDRSVAAGPEKFGRLDVVVANAGVADIRGSQPYTAGVRENRTDLHEVEWTRCNIEALFDRNRGGRPTKRPHFEGPWW